MNSTASSSRSRGRFRALKLAALALLAAGTLGGARTAAAEEAMPRPPQLERDVQFWIRVYTQVDTNSGFLKDQYNLGVVYDTLHFAPNSSSSEREHVVETARVRIAAALKRIADAPEGSLTAEDQHIKDMWGQEGTPARLKNAVEDIRFQLGQ